MKTGDKVTGVPLGGLKKEYPMVTGTYEVVPVHFMNETVPQVFIKVGQDYIDCENIKPAGRREKETVIA